MKRDRNTDVINLVQTIKIVSPYWRGKFFFFHTEKNYGYVHVFFPFQLYTQLYIRAS